MISLNRLEPVDIKQLQFATSHYHVGGGRIVGNYPPLNQYIKPQKGIGQDCLKEVQKASQKRYYAKLDLAKGFYSVPVRPDLRNYLGIVTGGRAYRYTVMPMGLNVSPAIFQRWMNYHLRDIPQAINVMDDVLVYGDTENEVHTLIQKVKQRLENAGAHINYRKSQLQPQKNIEVFGYKIDKNKVSNTEGRNQELLKLVTQDRYEPRTKREWLKLIGKLAYAARALGNSEYLRSDYDQLRKYHFAEKHSLPQDAQERHLKLLQGQKQEDILQITTDASNVALGAILNGYKVTTRLPNTTASSAARELQGLRFALQTAHLNPSLWKRECRWTTDSQTAAQIVQTGQSKSTECQQLLQEIQDLTLRMKMRIQPVWQPGKDNKADYLSREMDPQKAKEKALLAHHDRAERRTVFSPSPSPQNR